MDIRNLQDIHSREEMYQWLSENHGCADELWVRVNRAGKPVPGVVGYVDAVEVALCFGWIDSVQKRIDDGKPVQRFTPRRKGGNWCWQNIERCRRLISLGEMTPAGLAVIPTTDPQSFIFQDWVTDALKADPDVWKNFLSFPGVYRRIKVDRIQHYMDTGRPGQAERALARFIEDTRNGILQPNWNDAGKLG